MLVGKELKNGGYNGKLISPALLTGAEVTENNSQIFP